MPRFSEDPIIMDYSTKNAQIELALADLNCQLIPNYRKTAQTYGVDFSTLRRRFLGLTLSKEAAKSEHWQKLTNIQEEVLIELVNDLTDRAIPPTPQIPNNLAEELIKEPIGKNWVAGFIKRHQDRLKSIHLRPIDRKRVMSEYPPAYEHFFNLVTCLLLYFQLN